MFPCPPCPKLSVLLKVSTVSLFRFSRLCFFFSSAQDSPLKTSCPATRRLWTLRPQALLLFDGTKLSGKELPADLGMESGGPHRGLGLKPSLLWEAQPGLEENGLPLGP